MRGLLIKNKAEKVSLSAYNYYGADFKLNVFNQDTNTYESQNLAMVEGIEPVVAYTANCTEARTAGQEVITVDDVTGLEPSDRIQVGNYIYGVASVSGSDITLSKALLEDLTGAEGVSRVGNMGVYSLDLSVANEGTYLVQAKDSVYGLRHSDAITVTAKSLVEMIDDLGTEIEENQTLIATSTNGWKVLV
jgi:hypothetical protein